VCAAPQRRCSIIVKAVRRAQPEVLERFRTRRGADGRKPRVSTGRPARQTTGRRSREVARCIASRCSR
jgi:hypothetical protein